MTLYGEGDYAMTVVQEVVATQSFLGMSEEIRNCQKNSSLGDCVTRDYLDRVQAKGWVKKQKIWTIKIPPPKKIPSLYGIFHICFLILR